MRYYSGSDEKKTEHKTEEEKSTADGGGGGGGPRGLTVLKEYGPLGVAVSLAVSTTSLALIYVGLSVGLDPHTISDQLPWTDLPPGLSKMGTFGIALLLNKMLIPFKLPLYVAATAWLGRRFPHLKQLGKQQ